MIALGIATVYEVVLAYSLFSFEELRGYHLGQLFICGRGYHFCNEEPAYVPTEIFYVGINCVRRIVVIDDSHPLSQLAKLLWEENKRLTRENARLANQNAQLIASHFRDPDLFI